MEELRGHNYLKLLHKQWVSSALISNLMISVAVSALTISILSRVQPLSLWWILPTAIIISASMVIWSGIYKTGPKDVARILNKSFPELEESTELLIKPAGSLNTLEKLQVKKINEEIINVPASKLIFSKVKRPAVYLSAALIMAVGITQTKLFTQPDSIINKSGVNTPAKIIPDKIPAGVRWVKLKIIPPAYTRRSLRQQSQFSVTAEEGSLLEWEIRTSQAVKSIKLIFNDKEIVPLHPSNEEGTQWTLKRSIISPGFYQVDLDGKLSDLYKLEIIKDQPPVIRIVSPTQYSSIDFGEPQQTSLQVLINDDYGINDAFIAATVSSGKGEGVSFKEQKIPFRETFSGSTQYRSKRSIDLKALGMVPGDELYFYIQARDSRRQDSRSDMYIVTIQDTAQLMSLDGMLSGVNLVPEYFRSQRQIIIDTEKLLRERSTISVEDFNQRSNELGSDQKILRLRYGKFLGEESDTEIGGVHDDEEEHDEPADFGNAEKLMDAYVHKHDVAEDATFFEPELKAQLKATLSEMWKSELRLRTYKPSEALPFEYKALRLLKDLQQKSRVYVAKTSFKPPVIKDDKRLSGELDKIIQPQAERKSTSTANLQNSLRLSASVIAGSREVKTLTYSQIRTLQEAGLVLAERASAQPGVYLRPLGALRSIIRSGGFRNSSVFEIKALEGAFQKILTQERRVPQSKRLSPGSELTDEYFNNLKRTIR